MPESNGPVPLRDLEALLQQTMEGPVTVEVTDWKHLTDPGENFGSLILAVNANVVARNGKQEKHHLVCKMPPKSEYLLDLFNSPMAFKKELYFYTKIAPAFLQLQLSSGGFSKNELVNELVPRFYGGRMSLDGGTDAGRFDSQAAIVLENLNYAGYATQDRIAGMDLQHMEFGVRELAKLHAITCGYRIKNPVDFEKTIAPGLKPAHNDTAGKCVEEMVRKAVDNLRKMDAAKPHLERVLRTLEKASEAPTPKIERWCTFVHGDFWVNNMMYRYSNSNGNNNNNNNEDNKILSLKMVDFQLSVCDYGVNDLIFFLVSSAKKDIIDNNLGDLVDLYYETFVGSLRALKVDTVDFSREEFDGLLKECAPLKFPQCIMMVQVIKATRGSAPDVNSIKNSEAFLSIGKGKIYEDKLLHVLQTFVKNDWLVD
ncbi:uncharacterized protein LOC106636074 [Copidosoma floridanum]|uniref:uncharacterized protein LOC106636074 n=1 Tax=Copidosoma floridanum TaxID=29053 RepID=UPI0006C9D85C|nr:uncharacterized protein LOC106636074 [Copidosoma floridanum]XP_014203807.1 uncharacterized protein LOC106636074 [Copidosoma floridanum]XP_014203808.1 uncharacterized protein LOC106636074 [Copidosoma floridanum]